MQLDKRIRKLLIEKTVNSHPPTAAQLGQAQVALYSPSCSPIACLGPRDVIFIGDKDPFHLHHTINFVRFSTT
ncbi:hypothetical protein C1H46_016114 [Malus baccata]|uniref:Uncharacterized protein n=1 Tax=Malus baccata TaxID=106549 RepID=A0A540MHT8_MALBA|nr:hypothetical protein C1H46_016114 [Malus baccata]